MNFETYQDREALMMRLADTIASELGQALRTKGKAVLCVPGGTTPGPVFDLLSEVDLDWGSVYVMLNDERWVNEESERSNTALLRRRLLRGKARSAHLAAQISQNVNGIRDVLNLTGHAVIERVADVGNHHRDQAVAVGVGRPHRGNVLPIPKDRDLVGNLEDLIHLVGDVDNADAARTRLVRLSGRHPRSPQVARALAELGSTAP